MGIADLSAAVSALLHWMVGKQPVLGHVGALCEWQVVGWQSGEHDWMLLLHKQREKVKSPTSTKDIKRHYQGYDQLSEHGHVSHHLRKSGQSIVGS